MLQQHSLCRLIRTTRYYLYFTFLQILLSLSLITILLLSLPVPTLPLQLTIIGLLLADIIIRLFSDSNFIHKISNKIDLSLLVVATALLGVQLYGGAAYEPLEEVEFLAFGIRYGMQLFRIVSLIKQSRELRQLQKMGDITLPELDVMEELDGYYLHSHEKDRQ